MKKAEILSSLPLSRDHRVDRTDREFSFMAITMSLQPLQMDGRPTPSRSLVEMVTSTGGARQITRGQYSLLHVQRRSFLAVALWSVTLYSSSKVRKRQEVLGLVKQWNAIASKLGMSMRYWLATQLGSAKTGHASPTACVVLSIAVSKYICVLFSKRCQLLSTRLTSDIKQPPRFAFWCRWRCCC